MGATETVLQEEWLKECSNSTGSFKFPVDAKKCFAISDIYHSLTYSDNMGTGNNSTETLLSGGEVLVLWSCCTDYMLMMMGSQNRQTRITNVH